MSCQRCGSERVLHAQSHGRDCQNWSIGDNEGDGYLPRDFGIGAGDDMSVSVCLDCGQMQGTWPRPKTQFEMENEEEE